MRIQGSVLYGQLWLPQGGSEEVNQRLQNVSQNYGSMPSGQLQLSKPEVSTAPPTYFHINAVTQPFQEIVNTYGIPRYQEVNPGIFTVFTFPFLFGVMFADIGHGFCLLLLGLYLMFFHSSIAKSDSVLKPLISARYMFVLMGLCGFYNGWIYNDFISLPINLFGSCFEISGADTDSPQWVQKEVGPTPSNPNEVPKNICTYPFGIDPVWANSSNELTFINSYKMKLSVIIGVIHMLFGIAMKGCNSLYFKNWLDFFFEFIPQFLFLVCTFGYMDFLVIYKWLVYFPNQGQAPSIITLLINMVLTPTATPDPPLWGNGQSEQQISILLVLIAVAVVPIMLLPKPLIINSRNKKQQEHHHHHHHEQEGKEPLLEQKTEIYSNININVEEENKMDESAISINERSFSNMKQSVAEQGGHGHEDSSEIFVHQGQSTLFIQQLVIETIEFVLGSISNTASYLRLWALSLAHGQLAEVFFTMTLAGFIKKGGFGGYIAVKAFFYYIYKLLFGYVIFSFATFGVLMLMDVMECFLHALRLHWVEFQNKFYKADGYLFVGYSYQKIMTEAAQPPPE